MFSPRSHGVFHRGFSLTELLIVAALIAIVSILVFPVSAHMRRQSQAMECVQNLRQVGTAFHLYIQDSGQQIVTRRGGASRKGGDLWPAEISARGYLREPARPEGFRSVTGGDPKIFTCPAGGLPPNHSLTNWSWYTYGLNLFTSGHRSIERDDTMLSVRAVASIQEASRFVLLADSSINSANQQYFRISQGSGNAGLALRHGKKGHALFFDGHVEALTRTDAEQFEFPAIYEINP